MPALDLSAGVILFGSLEVAGGGSIFLLIPSSPAFTMTEKTRYGLEEVSECLTSMSPTLLEEAELGILIIAVLLLPPQGKCADYLPHARSCVLCF